MFPRGLIGVFLLPCAIALGCGNTTATGGTGGTTDASSAADTGGALDAAGADASTADAPCDDSTGCFENSDVQDGSAGTDVSADTGPSTCPPVLKDKALGQHGKTCTQDSDCMYGLCQKGGFLAGYDAKLGYCTKDCACSDATAQCSSDNAGGKEFICGFELSKSGGNPKAGAAPEKRCSLHCKTDANCAAWNSTMPHCIGSTQYVSSAGVCGYDPFK